MQPLTGYAGRWRGENAFRLMPDDPTYSAPATATVTLAAGGHLAVLAYTWVHPDDGPQDGVLLLGPTDPDSPVTTEPTGRTAVWGDSWHQSPEPRSLEWSDDTDDDEGTVTLGYDYTDDGWRWQVVLGLADPGRLSVRMENVPPESTGEPSYPPMVMVLRRA